MSEKPNILLIVTDQQRADCLGVEGHPVLQTPNMDALAARGARFTHFYSGCPSCIAARRSLMAGQNAATHGMVGYEDGVEWDAPPTLPGVLREQGYQTWLVGRSMHQFPPRRRFGYEDMEINDHMGAGDYDDWLAEVGPRGNGGWYGGGVMHNDWTAHTWPLEEHLHFTNWTVSRALRFLERRDPSSPFFLTVSFLAPHPPLQPPAFYFDRYLRTGVPSPAIGEWATPPTGRASGGQDLVAPDCVRLEGDAMRSARAAYFGLINHVDDQIRRLLLTPGGWDRTRRNETIVVFTSDHGEMLGDHYCWRKSRAYEASARVPFLMVAPDRFGLKPGTVVESPCTLADIMPTLLDMAGAPIPGAVDGQSVWPLLRGDKPTWRNYVHIEHAPNHQAVTDGREKYIWSPSDGKEQFFDLTKDRNECHDLAGDPAQAVRLLFWRRRLMTSLKGRPEGFTDGKRLIPGRPYPPVLGRAEPQADSPRRRR